MPIKISKLDAVKKLQDRIQKGIEILNHQVSKPSDLEEAQSLFYKWNDYNTDLLKNLFVEDNYAKDYSQLGLGLIGINDFDDEAKDFISSVKTKIRILESILE